MRQVGGDRPPLPAAGDVPGPHKLGLALAGFTGPKTEENDSAGDDRLAVGSESDRDDWGQVTDKFALHLAGGAVMKADDAGVGGLDVGAALTEGHPLSVWRIGHAPGPVALDLL